jgi:hypothetical protein
LAGGCRNLIIDTNLFLVLVIGGVDDGVHIKKSNRLNKFSVRDYDLLLRVMLDYDEVFITPYIAAEVSNLIDLHGEAAKKAYMIAQILFKQFPQVDTNIAVDSGSADFIYYGITDSSLSRLAKDYVILTDDSRILPALFNSCAKNIIPYSCLQA